MSEDKLYQIYYDLKHYQQALTNYQTHYKKRIFSATDLLVISKAYFINHKYLQAKLTLHQIPIITNKHILYERQMLLFKTMYQIDPNDPTLKSILGEIYKYQKSCPGPQLNSHHRRAIDELLRVLNHPAVQPNNLPLQKQISPKSVNYLKLEGFPSYLIQAEWWDKWLKYINEKGRHPGPIANFTILNHIANHICYGQPSKQYMNTFLYPQAQYKVVNKDIWGRLYEIYGGVPIKRLFIKKSSFYSTKLDGSDNLIRMLIIYEDMECALQVPPNSFWQNNVSRTLMKLWGDGQLKQYADSGMVRCDMVDDKEVEQRNVAFKFSRVLIGRQKPTPEEESRKMRMLKMFNMEGYQVSNVKRQGGVGLVNLRNSCYLNASLQCLSNLSRFSEYFITNQFLQKLNISNSNRLGSQGAITCAFGQVMKQLWNGVLYQRKAITPDKFKRQFGYRFSDFNNDHQQDANQFLNFLLNCIHDDLNEFPNARHKSMTRLRSFQDVKNASINNEIQTNKSIVHELFRGYNYSTIECTKCNQTIYRFDIFLMLTLPIPPTSDYLGAFFVECDKIDKSAQQIKIYFQQMKVASQILDLVKKAQSKNDKKYVLVVLNCLDLKIEEIVDDDCQITRIMAMKNKNLFFIYQLPDAQEQSHTCMIICKYEGKRVGYPRVMALKDELLKSSGQSKLVELFIELLVDPSQKQTFLANERRKKIIIKNIRIDKGRKMFYKVIKVEIGKKLQLNRCTSGTKIYGNQLHKQIKFDLRTCLKIFCEKQRIDEEEGWRCQKCQDVTVAYKKQSLYFVNHIVIITLKRFKEGQKISVKIDYPIKGLDLSQFLDTKSYKGGKHLYDLKCVCLHRGSLHFGHYISICKSSYDGKWYQYDDDDVRQIEQQNVVSQNAYILFYQSVI